MLSQWDKARFEKLNCACLLPYSSAHCPRCLANLAELLNEGKCQRSPRQLEVLYFSIHTILFARVRDPFLNSKTHTGEHTCHPVNLLSGLCGNT